MIRKRNDSVKPGKGIDGTEGEDFAKRYVVDQWSNYGNRRVPDTEDIKGRKVRNNPGHAAYSPDWDQPLREGEDIQFAWATRDIFDLVNANSDVRGDSVNANSGPIKYGVDLKQGEVICWQRNRSQSLACSTAFMHFAPNSTHSSNKKRWSRKTAGTARAFSWAIFVTW